MPAVYRYEIAPTGRAQCQVQACKAKGDKIAKGELRMGTLVQIQEHDSWKWKHWGCVTPAQIANVLEQIEGLDDLDVNEDLDILDGYSELPDWAQEKIKYALINGHVHDEDWKGDPELNVRGAKGLHKRTPKKKAKETAEGEEDESASPKPKKSRNQSKKAKADQDDEQPVKKKPTGKKRKMDAMDNEEHNDSESEDEEQQSVKKVSKAKKSVKKEIDVEDEAPKPVPNRAKKAGGNAQVDGASNQVTEAKAKATRGRPRKIKAEPIPDEPVEPSKPRRTEKVKVEPVEESEASEAEEAEEAKEVQEADTSRRVRSRRSQKAKEEVVESVPKRSSSAKGRAKSNAKSKK